jgi:hypothetical protein
MANPLHKHPVPKSRRIFPWLSLGHSGQDFVDEINKFVDLALGSHVETLPFKFDCSLLSAFLHWHFSFLALVLTNFWWRKLVLFWSASFFLVQTQCMSIHPALCIVEAASVDIKFLIFFVLCLGMYPSIYFYAKI